MSDVALDWTWRLAAEGLAETNNGLWLDDAASVGAVVTTAGAFVGWVDTAWAGPGTPVREFQDVVHVPPEFCESLAATIERARVLRDAALRTCRYCGARKTPGHMHSEDVCQGCAERHLGVVH